MISKDLQAVTGAFGYTGKYIAHQLLAQDWPIITLTGHPDRPDPFDGRVKAFPYHFEHPKALQASLEGVDTLYNTYWVRFNRGPATYERAVANTRTMIQAARAAGVRRFVHISITHANPASSLPYFRGKGVLEQELMASSLSYAILRPTVIFGREDILINNIAWIVRRFPIFAVPGSGQYRLQPIFVGDLAEMAVACGVRDDNQVIDVAGPETYTFEALVHLIARSVNRKPKIIHLPPGAVLLLSRLLGSLMRDVLLTEDEIAGLMDNLLVTDAPPAGRTSLREWLGQNSETVGREYASELARHYR